mmetsp:Transcript_18060/g.27853  ORF Transcript_18060/g.27853 Transcript_18060/m.27853 type:complete len:89 (+) Transcript_18060:278-544(+)
MVGDISADAQAMFGTIFITSAFTFGIPNDPEHKDELKAKENDAKAKIANLFLLANILSVVIGVLSGYLMDRMRIWKLLVILQIVGLVA